MTKQEALRLKQYEVTELLRQIVGGDCGSLLVARDLSLRLYASVVLQAFTFYC